MLWPGQAGAEAGRWQGLADVLFHHYAGEEGLPSIPEAIEEDSEGFLWVGTQGGLARWDGYHFRYFRPDAGDAAALPDMWVQSLHTDPRGRMWVGTDSAGLARYDPARDGFVRYGLGPGGVGESGVYAMADDGRNGLWLATHSGLKHLDIDTDRISGIAVGATGDAISSLLRDRSGTLWIGGKHGLWRMAQGDTHPVSVSPPPGTTTLGVNCLFEDDHGEIWVGTAGNGAFEINPRSHVSRRAQDDKGGPTSLAAQRVLKIISGGGDEIWMGTDGHGIFVLNRRTRQTYRIEHDPASPATLSNNRVWSMHRDRSGNVWVGTTMGVDRRLSNQDALLTLQMQTSRPNGIVGDEPMSILVKPDGRIWIGSATRGVDILDPVAGRVGEIRPDSALGDAVLPEGRTDFLTEAEDGGTYISTSKGLYHADAAGGAVRRIEIPGRPPEERSKAICRDGGRFWVGGLTDGLWAFDGMAGTGKVVHFAGTALSDARVLSLAVGPSGELWIGTRNGLDRLSPDRTRIDLYKTKPTDTLAMPGGAIDTLLFDRRGRLWAGTAGRGIAVLDVNPRGATMERWLGVQQGLPDLNVDLLKQDGRGTIWASTDNGLARIDPENLTITALHRADGVSMPAYWVGSGGVTAEGEILFGGLGGVTVVRPERLKPYHYIPPVVVTALRVGGTAVPDIASAVHTGTPITIRPGNNSLAVEFASLDFSAPGDNRYAYRLEGFDRDWTLVDARLRLAAYTNLPPGRYTMRIRGTNRVGEWSSSAVALSVSVLPAWYQTIWLKLLAALATGLCVFAAIQRRTRYLRRRQRELERLVAERTSDLERKAAELEDSRRQIEKIAYVDALTGLPNRRMFSDVLQRLLASAHRHDGGLAVLLIDLDRFKHINDTFGHDAGDAVLVEAAARFTRLLRPSDCAVRLGGDEFAILLDDVSKRTEVDEICHRMVMAFERPIPFHGQAMQTSPSIGVAMYPEHGATEAQLYKAADLGLYAAKRAGRNTWRFMGQVLVAHGTAM